jgi:hypothetical protein
MWVHAIDITRAAENKFQKLYRLPFAWRVVSQRHG